MGRRLKSLSFLTWRTRVLTQRLFLKARQHLFISEVLLIISGCSFCLKDFLNILPNRVGEKRRRALWSLNIKNFPLIFLKFKQIWTRFIVIALHFFVFVQADF